MPHRAEDQAPAGNTGTVFNFGPNFAWALCAVSFLFCQSGI
jgi:hypothetical protein